MYVSSRRFCEELDLAMGEYREIVESIKALADRPVPIGAREIALLAGEVSQEDDSEVLRCDGGREVRGRASRPISGGGE